MKFTKTCLFLSAMTAMFICLSSSAFAQTADRDLQVSATVVKSCDINVTDDIGFGNYNPLAASALTDTGTIVVSCTSGTPATVTLSMGGNLNVSGRNMANGANLLNYGLAQDSAFSTPWTSTASDAWTAGAVAHTITVYGRLPSGQNVPAGSYADTVVATLNF
jgi:spore coat protein U-like protein